MSHKSHKSPFKYDYKQNVNLFSIRFVEMGLECDTLNVV
jgi:hypothetical protein